MAFVEFFKKPASEISTVPFQEGRVIFETDQADNSKIYLDTDGERINIGGRTECIDNLTSTSTEDALSANQGKELKSIIDTKLDKNQIIDNLTSTSTEDALSANQGNVLKSIVDTKVAKSEITDPDNYYPNETYLSRVSFNGGTFGKGAYNHAFYRELTNGVDAELFGINTNDDLYFGAGIADIATYRAEGGTNILKTFVRGEELQLYAHGANNLLLGHEGPDDLNIKTPLSINEVVSLIHVDKSNRITFIGASSTEDMYLKCRGSAFQAYTSGGDVIMQAGDGGSVRLIAGSGGAVYLGYGSSNVVTSDENFKDMIDLDERFIEFWDKIVPSGYTYKDVGNRMHIGFGARAVEQALLDSGLTTKDFAGLVIEYDAKDYGEEGEVIATHDVRYGLRYEEFVALNTYKIKQLEKVIKADAERIEVLESKMEEILAKLG